MIVKKNFKPGRVIFYVRHELVIATGLALLSWLLYAHAGLRWVALPFAPLGVLGTALAIFLGFRNNSAYARWWEARTIWGGLVNHSRTLARQLMASLANAHALGKVGEAELDEFGREMILRQIAFAHALRLHLRGQPDWNELQPLLSADEYRQLQTKQNKPNTLLQTQSIRLKDGVRREMIGQFDPISLEPTVAAFNGWQAACERIKTTPLPRHYDYFTRVFLWVFMGLLPPALLGLFPTPALSWFVIPVSVVIVFIYAIINRTGDVLENPFDNTINDVPLSALCNTIERDLREMLGETDLPPAAQPQDGFLF